MCYKISVSLAHATEAPSMLKKSAFLVFILKLNSSVCLVRILIKAVLHM